MASFENATSSVISGRFIMSAGAVLGGFWAAQMVTSWARNNVVDLGMTGADAVYSAVGAIVVMAFLPRRYGRPLALGMVASGGQTAFSDMGLI